MPGGGTISGGGHFGPGAPPNYNIGIKWPIGGGGSAGVSASSNGTTTISIGIGKVKTKAKFGPHGITSTTTIRFKGGYFGTVKIGPNGHVRFKAGWSFKFKL